MAFNGLYPEKKLFSDFMNKLTCYYWILYRKIYLVAEK